ncbi:MAG: hypothetical protein RQ833_08835 [Sphingomonadaceae bacterium]|nr:hypothetical protein [Sphingomonadaceae bacterium]
MAIEGLRPDLELSAADRLSYLAGRVGAVTGLYDWKRYVLVAVPVSAMPPMPPRGWEAKVLRDAAPASLVPPAAAAWRLRQGMDCIVASPVDGEAVGVSWIGEGAFDEDEAHLTFRPPLGTAWDTGLFIRPEARAGRAFAALWAGMRAWAEARGVEWSISRIADYNGPSRRAHARLRGRELGRVALCERRGRARVWGADRACVTLSGERAVVELPRP